MPRGTFVHVGVCRVVSEIRGLFEDRGSTTVACVDPEWALGGQSIRVDTPLKESW